MKLRHGRFGYPRNEADALTPSAWQTLPAANWNAETARHLLRRAGWTARPLDVERATREGLSATLDRLFPTEPPVFAKPRLVERFANSTVALQRDMQGKTSEERLRILRRSSGRVRLAVEEFSVKSCSRSASSRRNSSCNRRSRPLPPPRKTAASSCSCSSPAATTA